MFTQGATVLSRVCNVLISQALMVIAHKSTSQEIGILRKVFERYDTARNGSISQDEFKVALESYGYTDEEVERMFDGLVSIIEVNHCVFDSRLA